MSATETVIDYSIYGGIYLYMHFEWDEQKNQSNFKDHGIDFETAILCWRDPNNFDVWDGAHSTLNQERWLKFGRLPDGKVICVVYTELTENRNRIISAFSDKRVEKIYYEGQHLGREGGSGL